MSFKICTIGCGEHSTLYHGPSAKKYASLHEGVLLAGCCDINKEKALYYQENFGFKKYYLDYTEMLDVEKPDAVCLISPVELTFTLASKILDLGYPLILEKPPGTSRDEVSELVKLAEKKNVPNRVAFNRRFAPLTRKLKELLDENFKPGEIFNIYCEMLRVDRRDPDFSATAIHVVDLVRFLAGSDYQEIRFRYQELPHIGPGVTNIYMDCIFKSGATAYLNICPVTGVLVERTTVNLNNNTLYYSSPMWSDYDGTGRLVHLKGGKVVLDVTGTDISDGAGLFEYTGIYYENASFFDDVRAGRKPSSDLASTVQTVEVAECIRKRVHEYKADIK
jgi:myo-inositol 2-dehydrogenase / D-chiro-inositol 1-dehydrogenase